MNRASITKKVGVKSHVGDNWTTEGSYNAKSQNQRSSKDSRTTHERELDEIEALGADLDQEFNLFEKPSNLSSEQYFEPYDDPGSYSARRPGGVARSAPRRIRGEGPGRPHEVFSPKSQSAKAPQTARQYAAAKSQHWQKVQKSVKTARIHGRSGAQTGYLPSVVRTTPRDSPRVQNSSSRGAGVLQPAPPPSVPQGRDVEVLESPSQPNSERRDEEKTAEALPPLYLPAQHNPNHTSHFKKTETKH